MRVHPTLSVIDDAEKIADLVNEVWRDQYPNDKVSPAWTPEFFEWQFLRRPASHPAVCLGCSVDGELVGIYCGDSWPLRINDYQGHGTLLSCVSVKRSARHPAIAGTLLEGIRDWSAGHGSHHLFGFVNPPESDGVGRRYWTTRRGYKHVFLSAPRLWQCLPETAAKSEWALPVAWDLAQSPAVLAVVADTVRRLAALSPIAFDWSPERLSHQLHYGNLATTAVVVQDGQTAACAFHHLPTRDGAGVIGIVDFVAAEDQSGPLASAALAGAASALLERGCRRIFTLGPPQLPKEMLLRHGFVPCVPSYAPLLLGVGDVTMPEPTASVFTIYR